MDYDELHLIWIFLTIDSPLFIKLICAYIFSILCKNIFELLYLTLIWNASCKELQRNYFIKNLAGTKNLTSNTGYDLNIVTRNIYISSSIKTICIRILLTAVNTEQNGLWWVAWHMLFLNNWNPFIQNNNIWVYINYCM